MRGDWGIGAMGEDGQRRPEWGRHMARNVGTGECSGRGPEIVAGHFSPRGKRQFC